MRTRDARIGRLGDSFFRLPTASRLPSIDAGFKANDAEIIEPDRSAGRLIVAKLWTSPNRHSDRDAPVLACWRDEIQRNRAPVDSTPGDRGRSGNGLTTRIGYDNLRSFRRIEPIRLCKAFEAVAGGRLEHYLLCDLPLQLSRIAAEELAFQRPR